MADKKLDRLFGRILKQLGITLKNFKSSAEQKTMGIQREQLEADVLIVGAGPAGLACALRLANLIKAHNASGTKPELSAENIYVLEKGRELGAHQLSGAIMNPKALAELVPHFEKSAPLDTPVTDSAALLFTEKSPSDFPSRRTVPEQGQLRRIAQQAREMLGENVEAAASTFSRNSAARN